MKKLKIEWRHFETGGQTCDRCGDTGASLRRVIEELARTEGVTIEYQESHLLASSIAQSNMVLFNGVPLEELLDGAEVSSNECCSCSCLIGEDTECRTLLYQGKTYEDIPEELMREAALKALRDSA
ncbi:DUF2703 domain-containing protein [Trichloromonas acetexigens]|jgi:hypothetical protein|uniref:DUF2703 domain-containing protein n=1 Tax=Trichloromonas acetexigens TaxID=38815 RepID=A0A550JH95_9BACT|nr:DUF2703 domain-containing protein [Desulfuromonas acetexigens]TRO82554.1 DUF2703 domain-containing protein [Desulfuromonas acetexigens]